MFGLKHIIIMIVSTALIVGLFFLTKKWDMKKRSKTLLFVGIISEIVKVFFYIIENESELGGMLPKTDLPFQLCSIQILLVLAVVLIKNESIKRVILAFMMPTALVGGAIAILIPTPSSLNFWVITFQYYLYHVAIVVFALHILCDKELKLTVKDYVSTLLCLLATMFFAIYINSIVSDGITEVNFMYVVSAPVDSLPFLNENHGWFVYIMHYACIVMVAVTACYIKPIIEAIKSKIQSKKEIKE